MNVASPKTPKFWPSVLGAVSGVALVLAAQFGLGLVPVKTPTTPTTPTTPVVVSVVPEPSSVDRLVAAAKDRPTIIDEFEAGSRKVASEAREKLAKK